MRRWILVLMAIFGGLWTTSGRADPLTGDVAAADDSTSAASANPANAAFLDRSQVFLAPELFRSETLQIRYPGYAPISQNDSGLGNPLAMGLPGFIYKHGPRFGIGGFLIPPIGLSTSIRKEGIPIVILKTLDYVDLDAVGTLDGAAGLTAGYRFSDTFGIGVNLGFQALSYKAELTPSSVPDAEPLATVNGSMSSTDLGVGVRYEPRPGRLAFGVAVSLVSMGTREVEVVSPLMSSASDDGTTAGEDEKSGDAGGQTVMPLSSILIGGKAALGRVKVLADLKYTRADKEQRGFSLVDLKEKRKDVYDTVGLRLGALWRLSPHNDALIGFKYEPSSLGPGSRSTADEDGSAGFGTQELVMVFTGFESLTPYWQLGLGARWGFGRRKVRGPDYTAWNVATGLVYRRASLGIDEDGEQPGAYLHQKTFVPLSVTYKL